jgi:hypothetical protein
LALEGRLAAAAFAQMPSDFAERCAIEARAAASTFCYDRRAIIAAGSKANHHRPRQHSADGNAVEVGVIGGVAGLATWDFMSASTRDASVLMRS